MGRAPCCDKANVKKGPWSPEEDAKLKSYIEKHGTGGNWIALPRKIGLRRCGKSCRLRWLNYLRPNIKHGGFSEEEDNIICSLFISIGSRWSIIASQLPGRTDNDIKNYWNTKLKKRFLGNNRSNGNYGKRNGGDYMNMVKQEVKNDAMATCLVTSYNHGAHCHDQNPYWATELPHNLPNQSPSFKDCILELDARFSNEEEEEEKQGPMLDYTAPQVMLQTRSAGTNHGETGFQAMLGQSESNYSDEFLLSYTMTCGESNVGSWGYVTSLMTLTPSCYSDEYYNLSLQQEVLH